MSDDGHIAILGNGGWGTAVAVVLAAKGERVVLWGHDAAYLAQCERTQENARYLEGVRIPPAVRFDPDPIRALSGAVLAVSAIPTRHLAPVCRSLGPRALARLLVVSLTKGIETESLRFPSAILREAAGAHDVAVLSGPSMAEEVARGLPASLTIAHPDADTARRLQQVFSTGAMRVYASDDVVGVELGGAVKNVIAIAAGLCDGMKLGDNAKAALLARGLAELRRLGAAMGARDETFAGLSGVGDLYTSCASPYGRNRGFGERLGAGMTLAEASAAMHGMVVEGVDTAKAIHRLASARACEMPICEAVYRIIYDDLPPRDALTALLSRDLRMEG